MNLLDAIRKYNFYTGDAKYTIDRVSVSEVAGNGILQMVLCRQYGTPIEGRASQATLGSIFDIGLRNLTEKLNEKFETHFSPGYRMEKSLPNGVTVTGEPDIIDPVNKYLYDAKLSKIYAMQMCEKEFQHHYKIQLNLYRWLMGEDYRMFILWGLKDQSDSDPKHPKESIMLKEVGKIDDVWLVNHAVQKSDLIKLMINGDQPIPVKCENTWRNDVRCHYYCSYNSFCRYYKTMSKEPF